MNQEPSKTEVTLFAIAALGQTEQSFLVTVDFATKYIVTIALRKKYAQFVETGRESGGPTR